ncbi:hypothetical protein D9M72_436910 [compost metagenome]
MLTTHSSPPTGAAWAEGAMAADTVAAAALAATSALVAASHGRAVPGRVAGERNSFIGHPFSARGKIAAHRWPTSGRLSRVPMSTGKKPDPNGTVRAENERRGRLERVYGQVTGR